MLFLSHSLLYLYIIYTEIGSEMPDGHTALVSAVTFLEQVVERHISENQATLPTVRALAGAMDLSCSTVSLAVQELKKRGVLTARRGSRICVSSIARRTERSAAAGGAVYQRLASRIGHDIVNGLYGADELLPPGKVLSARYAVNERTLAKALRELAQVGVVSVVGKRQRVAGVRPPRGRDVVGLVAATNADGAVASVGPRTQPLVSALENHCGQASCRLEVLPYDRNLAVFRHTTAATAIIDGDPLGPPILGFIALNNMEWRRADGRVTGVFEALGQLKPPRRPTALIDDTGRPELDRGQRGHRAVRRIYTSSRSAGEAAARFLIERGHRHVAYIAPVHGALWSQQRLEGLVHVFAMAAPEGSVSAFVLEHAAQPRDYQTTEFDFITRFRHLVTPLVRDEPDHPDTVVTRALLALPSDALARPREHAILRAPVHQLGMQALACSDVTAWVACGDTVAFVCREFLRECGLRIPEDISLISFDNSPEAFTRNTTSYDFNVDAVARAAVYHVLGLPVIRCRPPTEPVEIKGWFVERGSSRALPRPVTLSR